MYARYKQNFAAQSGYGFLARAPKAQITSKTVESQVYFIKKQRKATTATRPNALHIPRKSV